MALTHDVSLTLLSTGETVSVWDKYDFTVDMFKPANPWTFTLWHSTEAERSTEAENRRQAWTTLRRSVKLGDYVVLSIDGAPQMVGVIKNIHVGHTRKNGATLTIGGRDLAANAVDWDADPTINVRNGALSDVLARLFRPLGTSVTIGVSAEAERQIRQHQRPGATGISATAARRSQQVDVFHPKPGERMWECAEKLVRRLGLLMWIAPASTSEPGMKIVVDVPNYDGTPVFTLKHRFADASKGIVSQDSNVLEGGFVAQIDDVPTDVTMYAHAPRGDHDGARMRTKITNAMLTQFTPALVSTSLDSQSRQVVSDRARTLDHATQEANRIMSEANRSFRLYSCTVQGHGQRLLGGVSLYSINTLAHVKDSLCELDEDMMIQRIQFSGSREDGRTTKLTLGTQGAIALTPAAS